MSQFLTNWSKKRSKNWGVFFLLKEGIRLANSNEMTKNHGNQIEEIKFEKLVQKQANLAEFFPEFQIKFLHFQILLIK